MRETRKLSDLLGFSLQARDGEIGTLQEIYFDDRQWQTRYFVVRTGSWLLGREVLIVPAVVQGLDAGRRHIRVDLSRQQVKDSPPAGSERPVSRHYEIEFHRYFGWQPYWEMSGFAPPASMPLPSMPPPEGFPATPPLPHLRSSAEVTGYGILARDGQVGHVADFLLDDRDWQVRYLVVDTGGWLTGRKVLVAPAWATEVNWGTKTLTLNLDQDAIRTAPPYDPDRVLGRADEIQLYAHYGKAWQEEAG